MFRTVIRFAAALVICLPVLAIAASTDEKSDPAVRKDRSVITGKWKLSKLVVNGKEITGKDRSKLTVINHADGKWELHSEANPIGKGTSVIDPHETPKTIDFELIEGDGAGKKFLGIYKLGKNKRSLCFAAESEGRPKEFASPTGSQQILVEFKRQKRD